MYKGEDAEGGDQVHAKKRSERGQFALGTTAPKLARCQAKAIAQWRDRASQDVPVP